MSGFLENDIADNSICRITNKDRLCEERTTILSGCWTSPVYLHILYIRKYLFLNKGGKRVFKKRTFFEAWEYLNL